jgi:hypothetical protein
MLTIASGRMCPPRVQRFKERLILSQVSPLSPGRGRRFKSHCHRIPKSFIPKGWSRLAQRFNAGISVHEVQVPKGRLKCNRVSRPFGTCATLRPHPALKRWAIVGRPSGTGSGRLSQILVASGSNPAAHTISRKGGRSVKGAGLEMGRDALAKLTITRRASHGTNHFFCFGKTKETCNRTSHLPVSSARLTL